MRSLSPEISRCRQKRGRGLWPLQTFSRQEVLVLTETGLTLARDGQACDLQGMVLALLAADTAYVRAEEPYPSRRSCLPKFGRRVEKIARRTFELRS